MACTAVAIIAVPIPAGLSVVPRRIRVLTVDSNQLVQEGLAAMIDREADMRVVATASTGDEALNDARQFRPDVVTLDLVLPDMPGEELARRILAEFPRTRIVAITSAQGHIHARRALDAGVHGYLSKRGARRRTGPRHPPGAGGRKDHTGSSTGPAPPTANR
jgi:CheY-like chemotaxis protein